MLLVLSVESFVFWSSGGGGVGVGSTENPFQPKRWGDIFPHPPGFTPEDVTGGGYSSPLPPLQYGCLSSNKYRMMYEHARNASREYPTTEHDAWSPSALLQKH